MLWPVDSCFKDMRSYAEEMSSNKRWTLLMVRLCKSTLAGEGDRLVCFECWRFDCLYSIYKSDGAGCGWRRSLLQLFPILNQLFTFYWSNIIHNNNICSFSFLLPMFSLERSTISCCPLLVRHSRIQHSFAFFSHCLRTPRFVASLLGFLFQLTLFFSVVVGFVFLIFISILRYSGLINRKPMNKYYVCILIGMYN